MVSRYACEPSYGDLAAHYGALNFRDHEPPDSLLVGDDRFNLAETDPVPVLVQHGGQRLIARHWWGLMPRWTRWPPVGIASSLIGVEAWHSGQYGPLLRHQRCIIPATRWYVWTK